jgi:hypothetical protein
MSIRAVNFVDHPISRRVGAIVIENDPDLALTDENSIVVKMVRMPAFNFARSNGELINVNEGRGMHVPSGIQNFTKRSTIVGQRHRGANNYTVDERLNRFPLRRNGLDVLLQLRWRRKIRWPILCRIAHAFQRKDNSSRSQATKEV